MCRTSVSSTLAKVYLYKPAASGEEPVGVKVRFVLSWSRPEGMSYCVSAGGECEVGAVRFLRADLKTPLEQCKVRAPCYYQCRQH